MYCFFCLFFYQRFSLNQIFIKVTPVFRVPCSQRIKYPGFHVHKFHFSWGHMFPGPYVPWPLCPEYSHVPSVVFSQTFIFPEYNIPIPLCYQSPKLHNPYVLRGLYFKALTLPESCIPKPVCSQCHVFQNVSRVLCFRSIMEPGPYVHSVLYFQDSVFPGVIRQDGTRVIPRVPCCRTPSVHSPIFMALMFPEFHVHQ